MAQLNDIDELKAGWRALSGGGGEGWRTIPIAADLGLRVRAGRHYPGDHEAVLFGFKSVAVPPGPSLPLGRGFTVSRVDLDGHEDVRAWLALSRAGTASEELFSAMVQDVLRVIGRQPASSEEGHLRTLLRRVTAWQDFMERGRSPVLGPEAEIGLVGELLVLENMLAQGCDHRLTVEAWKGPLRGLRDFSFHCGALEVKTSLSIGEFPARIGSLEQLDGSDGTSIYVAAIRVALGAEGRSLPQIAAEIGSTLTATPFAREMFDERLVHAGFLVAYADRYVRAFLLSETRILEVRSGFPRLVRANVPAAVLSAKYMLDLDRVDGPTLDLRSVLAVLGAT